MTHLPEPISFKDDPHTAYPALPSVRDIIDVVQGRLLRVALDEEGDADFSRLARGTQALVQLDGLLTRRRADRERKASESEDSKYTRLADMAPFADEDLEKLDRDAAKLRAMEAREQAGREAQAANDNDVEHSQVPARGCDASVEYEAGAEMPSISTNEGREPGIGGAVRDFGEGVREPPGRSTPRTKLSLNYEKAAHDRFSKPP